MVEFLSNGHKSYGNVCCIIGFQHARDMDLFFRMQNIEILDKLKFKDIQILV